MGNADIKPDTLEALEVKLTQALDVVKTAKGHKPDRVQESCNLLGISKQAMAMGLIIESKGKITQAELGRKLNIDERTLRKRSWSQVRDLLQTYRQYPS